MSDAIVSGLLAGYGVAIPVGAVAVLVASLAARTSIVVGSAAALGVATADGLYALIAVAGGAAAARLIRPVAGPLRWVAAVILAVLAVRVAVTAWRAHREPARAAAPAGRGLGTPWRAYGGLLAVTLLNPMTIVYFAALVLGRQPGAALTGAGSSVFVVAAFVASASWQLLIAAGGSVLGRALTGPRGRLGTALASSALILVLAARLLVDG
jgi:arginine exporter protein ArgO